MSQEQRLRIKFINIKFEFLHIFKDYVAKTISKSANRHNSNLEYNRIIIHLVLKQEENSLHSFRTRSWHLATTTTTTTIVHPSCHRHIQAALLQLQRRRLVTSPSRDQQEIRRLPNGHSLLERSGQQLLGSTNRTPRRHLPPVERLHQSACSAVH